MNKSQLPKLQGQRVRLRPHPRNERGEPVDSDWMVGRILDESVELTHTQGGEIALIGVDHIHEYLSDQSRSTDAVRYGFLTLHSQVFVRAGKAIVEPIPPPRAGGMSAVRLVEHIESAQARAQRLAREQTAEAKRQQLANSSEGRQRSIAEVKNVFAELDKLKSNPDYGLVFDVVADPRGRAVYLQDFSITCVWSGDRLHIVLWSGNVDFGGRWYANNTGEVRRRVFKPDFTAERLPVWREDRGGDILSTDQLIEACVTMLLEKVEQESSKQRR